MAKKIGLEAKLYMAGSPLDGSGPSGASWTELTNIRDCTLSVEKGEADVTTRGNNGWRARRGTLKDGTIEFEMVVDPGDTSYQAIRDAFMSGDEIGIAAMSGDIEETGEEGLVANCEVFNFSRSEPLEDAMTVSVTLRPSSNVQWYEVGA